MNLAQESSLLDGYEKVFIVLWDRGLHLEAMHDFGWLTPKEAVSKFGQNKVFEISNRPGNRTASVILEEN